MKFSINWLNDFVKVSDFISKPDKLCESLTRAGLEIEAVENFKEQFKNVVVGEILSVDKHPNADRLTLCKVSTGKNTYSIVCGAKNHKAGDKVALALEGAVLPGDFKIKKAKVRGEESEGMLASASELGLESNNKEDGILILDPKSKPGTDFATHYGLNDVVLDVNVTPNRSDCLSHLGLAREVSCLFDRSFSKKEAKLKTDKKLSVKKKIKVQVSDTKNCPRYSGYYIEGVSIKESPEWLKQKLQSVGLKSINNVVDVTNYVLWDRGQPLHAFDADKLSAVSIGKSKKGEKLLTLDDSTITLTGEELTIRDSDKPVALAGVIGGKDSAVSDTTKNIFLESAYFQPEDIRKTSRKFGIQTDSSYRFSRGIDFESVKENLDFAVCLIQELAGGTVSSDFYDIHKKSKKESKIKISLSDLNTRLGYNVQSSSFLKWMKQLKCEVKKITKESFEVVPPSFRNDLEIKEDLIEEFARLEGYDNVPDNISPKVLAFKEWDSLFIKQQNLQSLIKNRGWYQSINYSFSDPEVYKDFLNSKEELASLGLSAIDFIPVQNPISSQLSIMKNFLTPDIFNNVCHNFRHGNKSGKIFEISPVFFKEGNSYKQNMHLCLAQWGKPNHLWESENPKNVFHLKSLIESVLNQLSYKGFQWKQIETPVPFLHPKQTLVLEVHKKAIGYVGTVHPHFQSKYKIQKDIALAELNLSKLWDQPTKKLKFQKISPFLTVEKDLTFVIPNDMPVSKVQNEIQKVLGSVCNKVEVFDLYESNNERAVSLRLYLTPEKSAWTDKDLQGFQNQVIDHIRSKLSISIKQ